MGLSEELRNHFERRAGGIRLDPPALRDIRARARKRQRNQRLASGIAVLAVVAASIVGVRAIADNGESPEKIQVFDDSGNADTPSEPESGNDSSGTGVPPTDVDDPAPSDPLESPNPQSTPTTTPAQTPEPEPTPTTTPAQTPEPEPTTTTTPAQTPEPEPTTTTTPAQTPEPEPTTNQSQQTETEPTAIGQVPNEASGNCDYSYTEADWYTPDGTDSSLIDFRNRDFRNCDLSGAALSFANFSGSDLTSADLSGADLRYGFFNDAKLIDADLTGALLTGVDFGRADMTGADLSGSTRIYASFADAVIISCTDCTPTVPSSSGSGQEEAVVTELRRLPTPIVDCSSNGNDVEVSWNAIPGSGDYRVFLHIDRQRYLPGDLGVVASSTSHVFNGMDWEASYETTVQALANGEDRSVIASEIGTATCTTGANPAGSGPSRRLPAPSIDCSPGGDDFELSGTYDLSWAEIPGAAEYFITYQEEGEDVIITGGWQPHTTLGMDWAKPSTEYTISVQAFRDGSRTTIAAGEVGTAKCSFDIEK